jgi:putative FmdB family regulatory protein
MPIYEYQCGKCHHHLEALQKMSDKPLRECPECGKHTLKRLLSAPMFRLAGSGWYETDFKSDKESKRNLAGNDEAPAAADAGGEKKPSDTKADDTKKTEAAGPPLKTAESSRSKTAARKPATKKPATKKPAAKKPAAKKAVRKR